jgi:hypothetical protein
LEKKIIFLEKKIILLEKKIFFLEKTRSFFRKKRIRKKKSQGYELLAKYHECNDVTDETTDINKVKNQVVGAHDQGEITLDECAQRCCLTSTLKPDSGFNRWASATGRLWTNAHSDVAWP